MRIKTLGRPARIASRRIQATIDTLTANSAAFESRLVWMFGSPRSGSTWLLRILSEHNAVVPVDEPLLGFYLGPFVSDLPGTDARAMDVSTFTWRRVQTAKDGQFFAEEFADIWVKGLARLTRERFYAHVGRKARGPGPRRRYVVIKEPNGSQSADVIMRALPRAKLLFLLRDGRDVVDSELAANLPGAWVSQEFPGLSGIDDADRLAFVVQSAQKWLWRTEVVQEAIARHPGPKLIVRYEELLQAPDAGLRRILDWIGLSVSDSDLTAWIERHDFERMPRTGPSEFWRSASPGAWRQNLRPEEREAIQELLGPKLRELGYES